MTYCSLIVCILFAGGLVILTCASFSLECNDTLLALVGFSEEVLGARLRGVIHDRCLIVLCDPLPCAFCLRCCRSFMSAGPECESSFKLQ